VLAASAKGRNAESGQWMDKAVQAGNPCVLVSPARSMHAKYALVDGALG
jgi:hypothetical protein